MNRKSCLVTGSTGTLGRSLLARLDQDYDEIVLIGRTAPDLKAIFATERPPRSALRFELCDLAETSQVTSLIDRLLQSGFVPDAVVNCAGIGIKARSSEVSLENQLSLIQINFTALTALTLGFLPAMIARGSGLVINISSTGAFQPSPGAAVYAATKAAVNSLSAAVDFECRGTGVEIYSVCPGPFCSEKEAALQAARPGLFRSFRTMTSRQVVDEIFVGVAAQRRLIIPGRFNRLLSFFARHAKTEWVMWFVPLFLKGRAPSRVS